MNSSYKFNNQNDNVDPILKEIKEYNIFDFLNRVSALNLIPCNQNKCIVLDFLIDAILSSKLDTYNGTYVMSSSKFKKVIDLVMLLNIAVGSYEKIYFLNCSIFSTIQKIYKNPAGFALRDFHLLKKQMICENETVLNSELFISFRTIMC